MNIFKSFVSLFSARTSTPTVAPSTKRRGRPVGSGKRGAPKQLKYIQLPSGQLVRMGKGRPPKGATVVLKTAAEAATHNAGLTTTVAA